MTQRQLMQAVADALGWEDFNVRDVEVVFDTTAAVLAKELKKKDNVNKSIPVRGLARFTLKKTPRKPAREGTNPATGEKMMFKPKPAGKKVRMTPDKKLRDAVGA